MRVALRRHLSTFLIAAVTAAVTAGGPALAAAVRDGLNADQVDSRDAVGAGSTINARKGNLVATSGTTGRLPNNIIATAPDAEKLDGLNSSAFQRKFKRTIVVSPVGTEIQNGNALRSALNSIPSTGPTQPVPRQSWLLHLEPGAYQLTAPLNMRSYVDIEGSGTESTIIQCACVTDSELTTGVVRGAEGAALRDVYVVNSVSSGHAAGFVINNASTRLDNVTIAASAPEGTSAAGVVARGDASLRVFNSAVSGNVPGVPPLASIGALAFGTSTIRLINSQAFGYYAVGKGLDTNGKIRVATSMLSGDVLGTAVCVGAYDDQFVALPDSCRHP